MHLHCHSWFSLRHGLMRPEELLAEAQSVGITELALTDINNTSANWDFVRLAPDYGIRPILGTDFRNHGNMQYIALAHNIEGYHELCAHLSQYLHSGKPFPDRAPNFIHASIIYPWSKIKPSDFLPLHENEWIGVRPWEQAEFRIIEGNPIHRRGIPWEKLIALQTFTFRHKQDWNCHRLLRAIDHNCLLSKLPVNATGHVYDRLLDTANIHQAFAERPHWVHRSQTLLRQCSISLPTPDTGRVHNNQHTYTESEDDDDSLIRSLCAEGLAYRYPDHDEGVLERMEHELHIIRGQGFLSYFLINWDITSYARSKGYFYVGRGSGANSLVAYLLRITDVDPIELDLYFERFINLYRTNPPDFDIDFSWTDRDDITQYIFNRFKNVALVGAYSTFQYRAIVRELGKVFGLPKHEIDSLAEGKFNPSQISEMAQYVTRYSQHLREFPNALTVHSCGILIAERPMHAYGATFMPPKGFPTTHFDMVVAEDIGLFKFDILSQRGLGKIRDTLGLISSHSPEIVAALDIHDMQRFKTDPKVQNLLRKALATGCFYVESPAMRMLMRKLQVDTYLGLVAASSVIRPGVSKSGMMRAYIERHRNPKKRKEAHPILLKLMPETYGVMVYQEDVIKVAHHFAGLDLGEADVLRRGMSGKFRSREEFAKARNTFIQRALERGRPSDLVYEVWKQVESFAGYAFAKGHSASYAVESYQSLFLKAHWPLEYMTACINNFGGFYRTEFYIHEARMVGATIEAPCINKGHWDATVYPSKLRIYLGFNLVRGIEAQTINLLMQNRVQYGPFKSIEDTLKRVRLPLEQCLLLIRCGGFQFTKMSKQKLLWEAHFLIGNRSPSTSEITLFDPTPQLFTLPNLESSILEDAFDHIELFGFPLVSPFLLLTPESTRLANKSATSDALSHCIGQVVDVVGYLVTVKETVTSTGSLMCFGCFLDRDGAWLDTVHFPTSLQRFRFRGKGVYQIKGYVREEYGCHHVEVAWMEKLAYTADPRYAEDALTGQNLQPENTRQRSRNTLRANSNGGQLKRQINSDSS